MTFSGAGAVIGATSSQYHRINGRAQLTFLCGPAIGSAGLFDLALDGNRLVGTYLAFSCGPVTDGPLYLTKE